MKASRGLESNRHGNNMNEEWKRSMKRAEVFTPSILLIMANVEADMSWQTHIHRTLKRSGALATNPQTCTYTLACTHTHTDDLPPYRRRGSVPYQHYPKDAVPAMDYSDVICTMKSLNM